jgi:hypothetical protein
MLDQVFQPRPTGVWFFQNLEGPKAMSFLKEQIETCYIGSKDPKENQ